LRLRNGVAACAVSALAMVFSVQQGEHGPLVVYKLEVPKSQPAHNPAVQRPASKTAPQAPRLRSSITRVPQQPATRSAATPQKVAPRSLETLVMPASALPPPRTTPVPVAVPRAAAAPAPVVAAPLPRVTEASAADLPPASLQPRVLGTVAVSRIEALTADEPLLLFPDSGDDFRVVEDGEFGTAMINEDTGDSLTLEEVNDAAVWRRDTAERLRQVPIAPRF
jgi:hypothetical protein